VRLRHGLVVANGIAWSPDARTIYFSDSHQGVVWSAPWNESTGEMGEPVCFCESGEAAGRPDVAAGLVLAILCVSASAQDAFPSRPVHLIVPYPPGGGNDVVARLLGHKIAESLGQAVIVENKAGASGMIAGEYVARAAPDGYTIMIDHSGT